MPDDARESSTSRPAGGLYNARVSEPVLHASATLPDTTAPADPPVVGAGLSLLAFLLRPFLLPFLLLLAVGAAVLVGVNRNAHSRALVSDSQSRLILLGLLQNDLSAMENGERGYVITADPDFLTPYQDAAGAFRAHAFALRDSSDASVDREQLAQLEALVNRWLVEAAAPEIQARAQSLPAAARLISGGHGRALLVDARTLIDRMQFTENARLSEAGTSSAEALSAVRTIALSGLLTGMLLLILTAWRVGRTLSRSVTDLSAGAAELAAGQYHLRLAGAPVRELNVLVQQFNRMAEAVQEREAALHQSNAQLERSNQELERFAYIASHDLQEPLRTIGSYTELLARRYQGQLDARADQYIAFTVQATARMKTLIQDLLAYSRVRQGQRTFKPLDAGEIVREVVGDLNARVKACVGQVEVGPLPELCANAELLRHTFQNLIGNALKFHAPGRAPHVHVTATRGPDCWVFHVQDNGIGIEGQYHERIFGVFQRLHPMDEYSGSGIGLAVTRSAVELHGGTLWLDSVPGQGSTFHFSIPDRDPEPA